MFKFNVLPGLYFTDAYGTTEGNPANDDNAVNLNNSTTTFASKAAITVIDYNFQTLDSSQGVTISNISGTIKNAGNDLQTTTPNLPKDTVLSIDASGEITQPANANNAAVTLKGIIVVTSNDKTLGTTLQFGGGPPGGTLGGSLNLENDGTTHVKIQTSGTNKITINETAYKALKPTATQTTLKIGASTSEVRTPRDARGGAEKVELNKEESFKMYWRLLPPNSI